MSFHVVDKYFSQDFIDHVSSLVNGIELVNAAAVDKDGNTLTDGRVTKGFYFDDHGITDDAVSNALYNLVSRFNARFYGFDIWPDPEIQYLEYRASEKSHFDWHSDDMIESTSHRPRKFSVTIQLSDPMTYKGADFQAQGIEFDSTVKNKGSAIIFPSYEVHRVTRVTKGTRNALVAWFRGPRWR